MISGFNHSVRLVGVMEVFGITSLYAKTHTQISSFILSRSYASSERMRKFGMTCLTGTIRMQIVEVHSPTQSVRESKTKRNSRRHVSARKMSEAKNVEVPACSFRCSMLHLKGQ